MNKVFIAGHLGNDPETRFTPSGQKVTSFSVATNVRDGKEDVTIWWRVTVWGDRFDKMISFLKKGSAVMVNGQMRPPRSYVDKEGRTQISLDLTADSLEFSPFGKSDRGEQGAAQSQNRPAQSSAPRQSGFGEQTFGGSQSGSQSNHGQAKQQVVDEEEDPLPF